MRRTGIAYGLGDRSHGFGENLTKEQFRLARKIERSGITSYSQVVRAFDRGDDTQIEEWTKNPLRCLSPSSPLRVRAFPAVGA
jgi:hypothetical protein